MTLNSRTISSLGLMFFCLMVMSSSSADAICIVKCITVKVPDNLKKPLDKGGALSIDKPVDKGGGLSIDKPVDKGGGLSIDKPVDKGGALSINKVYVPEKLRIGRVKSIAEVIIPVCWGSPQDCRGMKPDDSKKYTQGEITQHPYYITARYICRNRKSGQISGKQCDVTQASSKSCDEASSSLNWRENNGGDPCTYCTDTDPIEYWDGTPPEHIQGGPCQGQ
jgi:hypothetical protein